MRACVKARGNCLLRPLIGNVSPIPAFVCSLSGGFANDLSAFVPQEWGRVQLRCQWGEEGRGGNGVRVGRSGEVPTRQQFETRPQSARSERCIWNEAAAAAT